MQQIPLAVARRAETGKGAARRLREEGMIPAIIYGTQEKAESLAVAVADLQKVLSQVAGSVAFLELKVECDSTPRMAMLQELQMDQVGRKFHHVDFLEIRPDKKLSLEVYLDMVGDPAGMADGGILNQAAYTIMVNGLVADIPDSISVDVSRLDVGDSMMASEVTLPNGVEAAWEEDFAVASCIRPAAVLLPEDEEELEEGAEGEEGEEGAEGKETGEAAAEPEAEAKE
jgi:large subunit ribosomal protein L25